MADPKPTFSYLVSELAKRHPDLAFLHLVEPRVEGSVDRTVLSGEVFQHDICENESQADKLLSRMISSGRYGARDLSSAPVDTTVSSPWKSQRQRAI